ncbi:hypothetical protein HYT26_04595 [Candidatus Pacearchaeota archaeon]|nr:hypothetical protein [Candidatus Pacearchaeota archaeon]
MKKKVKKQIKQEHKGTKITEWRREVEKEIKETEQEVNIEIPQQAEFFKTPVRFGNIPVDKLPFGCDEKEQYRKNYRTVFSLLSPTSNYISSTFKNSFSF